MIDDHQLTIRKGAYRFARSGAVTDHTLLGVATQFENEVFRKFTAMQPDQMAKRFTGTEKVLATLKYDGEGVFLYWQKGQAPVLLNAPAGGVRMGLPCLEDFAKQMEKAKVEKALLRGELYLPRIDGQRRFRSADVNRVSHQAVAEDLKRLRLAVFDVIMLDGKDLRGHQEKFQSTWDLLEKLVGTDAQSACHRPEGQIMPENELPTYFNNTVQAGDEGLVIRRLQRLEITKVKPEITIDAVVIGYVEGDVDGTHGVTSLLTALTYADKKDGATVLQTFARVGSGFTMEQRAQFVDVFSALKVDAPVAMTDSDGRTVHFVKPEIMVEIRGEDMVSTNNDRENRTQVFAWNGKSYDFPGLAACPRLVFATFRQLRPDKFMASGGARFEQLGKEQAGPEIQSDTHSAPQVIRREVYVKAEAVRKLIITKQSGTDVVPYLIYWVDYSAKRKDPLKVSTEAASTEQRADKLAEILLAEGVTKGFVKQ